MTSIFYVYPMKNPIFIFFVTVALLITFFYFYNVDLFQAEITSNGETSIKEVSFKNFFEIRTIPDDYAIKPTMQGWLLLVAIFLGLPTMLAYRVTLKRYPRKSNNSSQS